MDTMDFRTEYNRHYTLIHPHTWYSSSRVENITNICVAKYNSSILITVSIPWVCMNVCEWVCVVWHWYNNSQSVILCGRCNSRRNKTDFSKVLFRVSHNFANFVEAQSFVQKLSYKETHLKTLFVTKKKTSTPPFTIHHRRQHHQL